jgi:hypothetical protein
MIGPLQNQQKQLEVFLHRDRRRLELRLGGRLVESFALDESLGEACGKAFGAYFRTLETLFHEGTSLHYAA